MLDIPPRKTLEQVRKEFEDRGFTLISDEYKNNKQKLRYICPEHPDDIQTIRLNDLLNGHGCRLCYKKVRIIRFKQLAKEQIKPIDEIRELFIKSGYIMKEESYRGARHPIEYTCPKHPDKKLRIRYGDLKRGNGCRYCAQEKSRLNFDEVKGMFESKGYILLDTEYKNNITPMRYICPKHRDKELYITADSLRGGHGCVYCGIESISGENHYRYNHDLSEEERKLDRRYDDKIHAWRNSVFERDKYICQVCGRDRGGDLNAHHKDGFNWCESRRYDVDNGVTLCRDCHLEFHRTYGFGNNTEEQYEEWTESMRINEREAIN